MVVLMFNLHFDLFTLATKLELIKGCYKIKEQNSSMCMIRVVSNAHLGGYHFLRKGVPNILGVIKI